MSIPVLGSALSDAETIETETVESYKIPVTIGVRGLMVQTSKTSEVMLSYPSGRDITVFEVSGERQRRERRYNMPLLSSEDLGKSFYVYYPCVYIRIRPEPWCKNLDVNREGESY